MINISNLSPKAVAAFSTSLITGGITFVLTNYVPYLHHTIPTTLAPLINVGASSLGALVGAYVAKHEATIEEIVSAFAKAETLRTIQAKGITHIVIDDHSHDPLAALATSPKDSHGSVLPSTQSEAGDV